MIHTTSSKVYMTAVQQFSNTNELGDFMMGLKKSFKNIGIAVFVLSLAAILIDLNKVATLSYKAGLNDDIFGTSIMHFEVFVYLIFIAIPLLGSELLVLKNGKLLLYENRHISRRICSMLSLCIALFVIIILALAKTDIIIFYSYNNEFGASDITLPSVIISFVLSFCGKREE